MMRLKAAPFVILTSAALGGCASDSTGGQENDLTGGAASEGSPASGDLGSSATAGSAGGDSSQSSAPADVGPGQSDELASNDGAGDALMGSDPPAGSESTPGGASSESMSGDAMSGESMGSLDDDSSPSTETSSDDGSVTDDSSETDVGGDGSFPTLEDETSMDGDPTAQDESDMGGGADDSASDDSASDDSAGDDSAGDDSAGDDSAGDDSASDEPVTFATCPDENWNLVWGDDFDGPAGSAVDGSKWNYDSGPNWYNGELQYYSTGADNAFLDGNGNLVIEARRENREGRQYTSARLKTEGKHTFTYGRFEGRMKLPYGQGMWPALWMLGGNSWPNDGEIDIMENLGREPSIAHGTIHGPGYSGADGPGTAFTLPDGEVFSDDFHIFAVEWEPEVIRWYIDGEHYATKTPADIGGNRWVFDHPFFFLVNLAVGGEWPGDPDETTVFPQQFLIDYIRVCQQ